MGINGINDYSKLIANYRVPSIPSVSVDQVKEQDKQKALQEQQQLHTPELQESTIKRGRLIL